jgi:hypothetical protein
MPMKSPIRGRASPAPARNTADPRKAKQMLRAMNARGQGVLLIRMCGWNQRSGYRAYPRTHSGGILAGRRSHLGQGNRPEPHSADPPGFGEIRLQPDVETTVVLKVDERGSRWKVRLPNGTSAKSGKVSLAALSESVHVAVSAGG